MGNLSPSDPPDRRRRRIAAGLLLAALTLPAGAGADAAPCLLATPQRLWAERVVDGVTLVTVDGRTLRLAGVEVPRPRLAETDPAALAAGRRIARAARAALADRVEGRELAVFDLGQDRHGRHRSHLLDTETGQWIEEALVAAGLVRVATTGDDRSCVAALLAAEAPARVARRGLWGEPPFAVRPATPELLDSLGESVVTTGVVRSVGRSGGHIWLNFGDDIRRDFAAVMKDKDRDAFAAAGIDPDRLRGRRVVVRGVVTGHDGPRIELVDPEDIETTGQ